MRLEAKSPLYPQINMGSNERMCAKKSRVHNEHELTDQEGNKHAQLAGMYLQDLMRAHLLLSDALVPGQRRTAYFEVTVLVPDV